MLLMCRDEERWDAMSVEEKGAVYQEAVAYSDAHRPGGFYQEGAPLEPTSTATTVRMKNGKTIVTDGPFAETKEQLGGLFITDLPDLDEAIRIAALVPAAAYGTLEIRPLLVR